jgi:hypothetical protein
MRNSKDHSQSMRIAKNAPLAALLRVDVSVANETGAILPAQPPAHTPRQNAPAEAHNRQQ